MTETRNPTVWFTATVRRIVDETPTVKTFTFELPFIAQHLAGQHYELRLTSTDGYQAARLYSAGSAARGNNSLDLTIALLPGGEVSPYLYNSLRVGDQIEMRGPLGLSFVWKPEMPDPILLIAGGSGVVPMRCILQAHALAKSSTPVTLLYSTRTYDEIIYKTELLTLTDPLKSVITLSDSWPDTWHGLTGFLTTHTVQQALTDLINPRCYICGSTPFVEAMANHIVTLGLDPLRIKAERFG